MARSSGAGRTRGTLSRSEREQIARLRKDHLYKQRRGSGSPSYQRRLLRRLAREGGPKADVAAGRARAQAARPELRERARRQGYTIIKNRVVVPQEPETRRRLLPSGRTEVTELATGRRYTAIATLAEWQQMTPAQRRRAEQKRPNQAFMAKLGTSITYSPFDTPNQLLDYLKRYKAKPEDIVIFKITEREAVTWISDAMRESHRRRLDRRNELARARRSFRARVRR